MLNYQMVDSLLPEQVVSENCRGPQNLALTSVERAVDPNP